MYKIPGRQVYCESIAIWFRELAWIFIVQKLFAQDIDALICKCGSYGTPE